MQLFCWVAVARQRPQLHLVRRCLARHLSPLRGHGLPRRRLRQRAGPRRWPRRFRWGGLRAAMRSPAARTGRRISRTPLPPRCRGPGRWSG